MVKGGLHWIDVVFLFIQINKLKKSEIFNFSFSLENPFFLLK
jgi:hypothetical protein